MFKLGKTLLESRKGQGMVEYGLLLALISVAAIATIKLIGPELIIVFNNALTALK